MGGRLRNGPAKEMELLHALGLMFAANLIVEGIWILRHDTRKEVD
jgi:hypothetical protein